jgi:DNA-binding NarL/FixJ family response regulator
MASGLSNSRIAERLFISNNTVKFHVHNVLAKLGCVTRSEAICMAHDRRPTGPLA